MITRWRTAAGTYCVTALLLSIDENHASVKFLLNKITVV